MLTRTYIEKFNTIIKGSPLNIGINPVAELFYGKNNSRVLCYFDTCHIKKLVEDKTFADLSKVKHTLKIINSGSFDFTKLHCGEQSLVSDNIKTRASSFDLIFFLIPQEWDGGKGFDFAENYFNQGYYANNCKHTFGNPQDSSKLLQYDGATWFQARNGYPWKEDGIYSVEHLSKEYDKFSSEEGSDIIFARQRFDIGNEDIEIDITDIFNKMMFGEIPNYGIGIAFTPMTELIEENTDHYIGLLTHKTNTWFEPYVETTYGDYVNDDRSNFSLDKDNKLYLYCNINGKLDNLDKLPTCTVDDKEYEVKQFSKGIYYIDIKLPRTSFKAHTMHYDTWDGIVYHGTELDSIEREFTTKPNSIFFNISSEIEETEKFTPTISGIQHLERIRRGDIRKILVHSNINYSKNKQALVDDIEYRVYIKDGEREIDFIPFEYLNKAFNENYFILDTNIMIPNRYYIDIRYNYNQEMIMHHDIIHFDIVSSLNNLYA